MSEQKGQINAYTCEVCGVALVTVNRADGTTPFLLRCRQPGCLGMARSAFYRVPPNLTPTHEWYKPSKAETATLESDMREHVRMGGLLLRPIAGAPEPPAPPSANRATRRQHAKERCRRLRR